LAVGAVTVIASLTEVRSVTAHQQGMFFFQFFIYGVEMKGKMFIF
jgi:hypothetical protein